MPYHIETSLQKQLIQGELADLALYKRLRLFAKADFARLLDDFIRVETRHAAYWQELFSLENVSLTLGGKIRNALIVFFVRIFGEGLAYVCIEAIETHGVSVYLKLWHDIEDEAFRTQLKTILDEELQHEDEALTAGSRSIHPETIRNAFLGFNDGSVEILGAVSGLVAALSSPLLVSVSAITVAVAGAISMAAGAFLSTHAEQEVQNTENRKKHYFETNLDEVSSVTPRRAATIVGIGYLIGAAVPIMPFLFGATHAWVSIMSSGVLIILVSIVLAFLGGMNIQRRIALNMLVITIAVSVSYGLGRMLEAFLV